MSDREAQLERCLEEAALYKAQVEAGFRVLREALEWIMFRAEAAISGHRSALQSCAERAHAALRATEKICPRPPEEDV